jgi:CRP-like cAMP-binding protein
VTDRAVGSVGLVNPRLETHPAAGFLTAAAFSAWRESFFGDLPSRVQRALLNEARVQEVVAGQTLLHGGADTPDRLIAVVTDGLFRVLARSREGREATLRYGAHGDVLGVPELLAGPAHTYVTAFSDGAIVRLRTEQFLELGRHEPALAWAVARHVAQLNFATADNLTADVFLPVRARVARHLLDFARREPEGLMVTVSHQDLADATGSVRDVVSRVMQLFKAHDVIRRVGRDVIIVDPAALHCVATGAKKPQND